MNHAHCHWMKLMSSDCFSTFLQYLNLKDIIKLDTAFCNHNERTIWLNVLKVLILPAVETVSDNDKVLIKKADWLISKNIHVDGLYFKHYKLTFSLKKYNFFT